MEVCVILAGMIKLLRPSVVIDLVATMVSSFSSYTLYLSQSCIYGVHYLKAVLPKCVESLHCLNSPSPSSPTVAEALYGVGYPRRRYVAQNFSCSNFTYGLRNCDFSSSVDPECSDGPHVAGVRCRQSKTFSSLCVL